mgnify:CR=1 FL=1
MWYCFPCIWAPIACKSNIEVRHMIWQTKLSVVLHFLKYFVNLFVGVIGDGFMASGVTFQNTAGPVEHQAVAFRSQSDLSVIENCEFISNQDTLYAHSLRQYYKSCRIQGNVDFIFGNAAAFFQDCVILVAPRQIEQIGRAS